MTCDDILVYEDDDLVVVEKPVNMPSQPDKTGDEALSTFLETYLSSRGKKAYIGVVHRLDRPVGGLMVFAKNRKAAEKLSTQMKTRECEKYYLAVVYGEVFPPSGTLEDFLTKDPHRNLSRVVSSSHPLAKKATLSYRVLAYHQEKNLSLLEVELHTGRHHQIRVQWQSRGHPLYGDQKYGRGFTRGGQRLGLWSYRLSFSHPKTGEYLSFTRKPPAVYPWILFEGYFRPQG
ncbi:MAG: RluA family pseudouridine synthase [Brevinematales bacterium]|nr:RluA family pseudouridine synthase [Brevinematales bacterium]